MGGRYERQMILPQVGQGGQSKLLASRVLIVGLGGLGNPCALYLAGAGVRTLGLADSDVVEESNLHRQIAYRMSDLGSAKATAMAAQLFALNPQIKTIVHSEGIKPSNVLEILADYDAVVDATDQFSARYLLSDACVYLKKPLVHASVQGFYGQVGVFCSTPAAPCFRCFLPEPLGPVRTTPGCSVSGVVGPVVGVLGAMQATETLKILLDCKGAGALAGRLLLYDGLECNQKNIVVKKNPHCLACGKETGNASQLLGTARQKNSGELAITRWNVIDLQRAHARGESNTDTMETQTPGHCLIDVRTKGERASNVIFPESIGVPLDELEGFLAGQNAISDLRHPGKLLVFFCVSGARAQAAAKLALEMGHSKVCVLLL